MSFTSTVFLFLFFPASVLGYYLIHPKLKNVFLVVASLLFYAMGDFNMLWLLLVSMVFNYSLGLCLNRAKHAGIRRLVMLIMLIGNFGALFYYKYFMFSLETINTWFGLNFVIPVIALPLGISFYTFRTVSYTLDVYWETTPVQKNPIDFALYVSFFPQVTMGPITKYSAFESQLHNRRFDLEAFSAGIKRIIIGLFKKLVFANTLGVLVDNVFAMQDGYRTVLLAWFGILSYLLQLYYDFSGYSDIAIGIGMMFGFSTPQNFNYPYIAKSVVDFWNRWHITLGVWLKDYIYTPVFRALLKNRTQSAFFCNIIALLATWVFAGVWHGAGWKFLIYGLYYFVFIALERTVENYQKKRRKRLKLKKQPETKLHAALAHVYLAVVIVFGQLLFRADSVSAFGTYVGSMFGLAGNTFNNSNTVYFLYSYSIVFVLSLLFCFPIIPSIERKLENRRLERLIPVLSCVCHISLAVIAISYAFTNTYQSFIYFQF